MSIFKSYDIRGIYNEEWNRDTAYRIGNILCQILNANKILVGMDGRVSSPEIFKAFSDGATDYGTDTYYAGLTTTPMIYFGTSYFDFPASVMITASHNPKNYNGLKVSAKNSIPIGYETGLNRIEEAINKGTIPPVKKENKGKVIEFSFIDKYTRFMENYRPENLNLAYTVDFSNGMANLFSTSLFYDARLKINDFIDGNFPGHEPNPLETKNQTAIKEATKSSKSDLGIIFDGDADRVMFIDENGNFIQPDYIMALLGLYFKGRTPFNVLYDIRTSKSVDIFLKELGASCYMWKVGHAYAKRKLREIDGIFGGELAGHYYYKDFYYCDSGVLTSLIVLNMVDKLKSSGKSLSSWLTSIVKYANSGEINFTISDKQKAIQEVVEHFTKKEKVVNIYDFDGYRIEFDDWWFNIRPSNTEPYLRLIVEARDKILLSQKLNEFSSILNPFLKN